jgi:hypothetical protein
MTIAEPEERLLQGEITGAVNAGATVLHQLMTGDPSGFIVAEPTDTVLSGPNRVLATTIAEAWHVLDAGARESGLIRRAAGDQLRSLESALRVSAVREVLSAPGGRRRVSPHEKRQTSKMRAPLYRLAYSAATLLDGVRALDPASLTKLFSDALLPSLETWRRFELAVLLEAALSLSKATGDPVRLDLALASSRPAALVGPFEVHWQYAIHPRDVPDLDPGEEMARELANSLGVSPGVRRADVAVLRGGTLAALIECKWFQSGADAQVAVADACDQLVVYARDHVAEHGGNVASLLSQSIAALADRGPTPRVGPGSLVGCLDLGDIERACLDEWAVDLAHQAVGSATRDA